MSKSKSHVIYKNKAGEKIVGVTTVISLLDKPAIHFWIANIR